MKTISPAAAAEDAVAGERIGSRPVRAVFTVGGLYSLSNGVAWIMRDLAAALGRAGSPVTVCGADCWGRGAASVDHIFEPPSRWVSSRGLWLGGLSWSPLLKRKMWEVIRDAEIVHNHSLWMLPNSYGSRIAARQSKPVVITAHGALEPWALQNSGWKKRLVGRWFQHKDLERADCIHVNSRSEAVGIRQYGIRCPVAVIPNGIHLADFELLPERGDFFEQTPVAAGKRIALFMARLHQKKGLGHLIPAWACVAKEHPEWHLVLAGPDSGYESAARRLVNEHGIRSNVSFTGPLQGEQKLAALSAADVYLQPSFSEGFSMSIIEAMACHLPVLLTPGCNFPEAVEAGAAACVEPTIPGTVEGLRQLLAMSAEECRGMGSRGRELVENTYTWDHIAAQMLELYRWLIEGGAVPSFIETSSQAVVDN